MIRTLIAGSMLAGALVSGLAPGRALAYNGATAAHYADQYWSSYNSAYPSFANKGGDCTNFVSQALFAGGIKQRTSPPYSGNAAWYMTGSRPKWSWSAPWVNAQDNQIFLSTYLSNTVRTASVYGAAPGATVSSGAQQGDVVYYDWTSDRTIDHESIIATTDGQYVDAHTNNRYHAYWTLAQYNAYWQTTTMSAYHIPSTDS